jgi:Arc/MetJ-type ribon-helix-helix transcriptional regulator
MVQDNKVTLKIPRPIYDRLKKVIEGSGFGSVNEFVVYVLRDLISSGLDESADLTKKEVDAIRQRLKNLGYL